MTTLVHISSAESIFSQRRYERTIGMRTTLQCLISDNDSETVRVETTALRMNVVQLFVSTV
jgi:hypothetical protein